MKPEKQLYQWDVNQYLTGINPAAQYVDYKIGNEVIRIKADGTRCRIPDEVLQTYGGKTCYERYPDGTYRAYSFTVLYAPKPPDYVYTPEERTTFEALTARVDAAIDEIKRRADSGEFTPVKGVDYFTDAEKAEMMESVSSGAVGEFREVVDTATTEYNVNHTEKMTAYDTNASEKLTTYDTNAEQHTTDYNRNAEVKLEAYNSNHAAKVAEYNQNAETKTAEFDANAAALQTEVDRLRVECDQLAAENRKQENRISALLKLNKGQTYDILTEEGETASRTAPSGAKYVGIDKVGGKSIVWNQLFNAHETRIQDGLQIVSDGQTITIIGNSGSHTLSSFTPEIGKLTALNSRNHRYLYSIFVVENSSTAEIDFGFLNRPNFLATIPANYTGKVNFVCTVTNPDAGMSIGFSRLQPNTDYNVRIVVSAYDLTLMFGAGNEPTAEQVETMFPADSYPYNSGEIISSTTANVELEGKNLWNDSDPAFTQVLTNAGFLYNSGVWNTNNVIYSSVNIGTIPPQSVLSYDILADAGINPRLELFSGETRILSRNLNSTGEWIHHKLNIPSGTVIDRIVVNYKYKGVCKIKNIQLERGTTETAYSPHTNQALSTGFPELNSAGTAHDEIDMDGGTIQRNVGTVDLGTLDWTYNSEYKFMMVAVDGKRAGNQNLIISRYNLSQNDLWLQDTDGVYGGNENNNIIYIKDLNYSDPAAFKVAISGVMLHYELETPTTEPVTIPEALQEWLPVEAGGTVTFRNADESKQLAVPNAVSWVRKLNEVE